MARSFGEVLLDTAYPREYFSLNELMCKCGCGKSEMNFDFMRKLNAIRLECGFPFVLNSAYRCPEHNESVSKAGSKRGPHVMGRAVDIRCDGGEAMTIIDAALRHGIKGLGISQKLGTPTSSRYVHLDDLTTKEAKAIGAIRPYVWSY